MKPRAPTRQYRLKWQRGVAAVEFALVAAFGGLFIVLFGVIELGRVLYMMNSANEATALGARVAIVCDMNDDRILKRMQQVMPTLTADNVSISYYPGNCTPNGGTSKTACQSATVSIASGMKIDTVVPFVPLSITLPEFKTTLTREAMNSSECA